MSKAVLRLVQSIFFFDFMAIITHLFPCFISSDQCYINYDISFVEILFPIFILFSSLSIAGAVFILSFFILLVVISIIFELKNIYAISIMGGIYGVIIFLSVWGDFFQLAASFSHVIAVFICCALTTYFLDIISFLPYKYINYKGRK